VCRKKKFEGFEKKRRNFNVVFEDTFMVRDQLAVVSVLYVYSDRTAPLTSRRCILSIYSTNIRTNILNTLNNLRFSLFKIPFISQCYLVWFLYYSHFKYTVC
jgi:hypothetical protein